MQDFQTDINCFEFVKKRIALRSFVSDDQPGVVACQSLDLKDLGAMEDFDHLKKMKVKKSLDGHPNTGDLL